MQTNTSKPDALVVLSGGQDSTTCLFWARKFLGSVAAISFDYGQRHAVEIDAAATLCQDFGIPHTVQQFRGFTDSALLDTTADTLLAHPTLPDRPASFVPGRNLILLTLAAAHAQRLGCTNLVAGFCQMDASGYPDCRAEFVQAARLSIQLALDFPRLSIYTPLMTRSKAETWKLARELSTPELDVVEIVRTRTLTDYHGDQTMNEWGKGRLDNPASRLRADGYFKALQEGWI